MRLQAGLERLGVEACAEARARLQQYLSALERWNQSFNLVSPRSVPEALSRHLLDSLSVLPYLRGSRLLDIGTGAGLPGLPLAITRPSLSCTLLDANIKKVRFCRQMVVELELDNVEVVRTRLETFSPGSGFDVVISRAFASIESFVEVARPLCAAGGRIICMTGTDPTPELDGIGAMRENARVTRVEVPGVVAERHLVVVEVG